jgi:U3 small nucleolar RNA-associated protein 12
MQFELIQKMDGHHGEIWAAAIGRNGKILVTGSHDKSIRFWENTEEPLFLEEEREKEMEKLYEGDIADNLNREDGIIGAGADGGMIDPSTQAEATMVQKHTTETLMAGEKIMEALELADCELEGIRKYNEVVERLPPSEKGKVGPPARNPVLVTLNLTPYQYVLRTVEKVQAAALYDALLVLPFNKVSSLLYYMDIWASQVSITEMSSECMADLSCLFFNNFMNPNR